EILLELTLPSRRLLGDHRDAANPARTVGMPGPFAAIDELRRLVLANEEADDRHVGLRDAHGAEPGVLGPVRDFDRAIESERRLRIEPSRLEGLEGSVGAVGGERHVGEPAALLQPFAPLGVERRVLDDAQDLEIILVEDHQMVGSAELLVEAARLHLEAEPLVGALSRVDAIDHDHHMIEPLHRALAHAGLRRTMLMPLVVITSSPFWLVICQCSWMTPSCGLLLDGTLAAHSTQPVSVSPGRTGLSQRSSSRPGEPSAVRRST